MRKSKQYRNKVLLVAFGEAVRARRRELGLSQSELATKADVHRTYITDVEGGLRNVSFLTLARIGEALSVDLSTLIKTAEENMLKHSALTEAGADHLAQESGE